MSIYNGIIDDIDMQQIGLQRSLDNTLDSIRIVVEEGYKHELKAETRAVMHLSLLDRFGYFYCLSSSHNQNFAVTDFGIRYFLNSCHLKNKNKGLIWAVIEPSPPPWLEYQSERLAWVRDFDNPEIIDKTIKLVSIGKNASLLCVLFYVIKCKDCIVGTLAVDIYTLDERVDAKQGIPIYTVCLNAVSSIIELLLEGLHTSYYDAKLNRQSMKRIFSSAYLAKIGD